MGAHSSTEASSPYQHGNRDSYYAQQPQFSHTYPTYPPYPASTRGNIAFAQGDRPGFPSDTRRNRFQRTYSRIADDFTTLDQVTDALQQAGLESSNLIVGIDFTKSNEWTGKKSFNRRSLHHIGDLSNPYEHAISIIGRTLSSFDEDGLIPCFGFGDASTHDQDIFSFYPNGSLCDGLEAAKSRYREIVPTLRLAGPTSFAPIIEMAISIVEESGGQYHVLLIIADGQVTRSVETGEGKLSIQEQSTIDAIVLASQYPLSIVLVGVGDGPWDMMKEFDDNIPMRSFDNFQFVNFTDIMLKNTSQNKRETEFALAALMEIPSQYRAAQELGILGRRTGRSPGRVALPTPSVNYARSSSFNHIKFQAVATHNNSATYAGHATEHTPSFSSSASWDSQACPVCLTNPKDMAFGCGHRTCSECGPTLGDCPICRRKIEQRIKLF